MLSVRVCARVRSRSFAFSLSVMHAMLHAVQVYNIARIYVVSLSRVAGEHRARTLPSALAMHKRSIDGSYTYAQGGCL